MNVLNYVSEMVTLVSEIVSKRFSINVWSYYENVFLLSYKEIT